MNQKEKGIMENKIVLEINLESDKRAIASILVANGYAIKIECVKNGNSSDCQILFGKMENRNLRWNVWRLI